MLRTQVHAPAARDGDVRAPCPASHVPIRTLRRHVRETNPVPERAIVAGDLERAGGPRRLELSGGKGPPARRTDKHAP